MRWILWIVLFVVGSAADARAAVKVETVYSGVRTGVGGGWVPVRVSADVPAGGGVIWVKDARGGAEFGRAVAGGEKDVLISLPLVRVQDLKVETGLAWRVQVRVGNTGEEKKEDVGGWEEVTVQGNLQLRGESYERAAVVAGWPTAEGLKNTELAVIQERDVLTAPAMCLLGIDTLVIDAQKLGKHRAAAFVAAGVRLVHAGQIPPGGELGELGWVREGNGWVGPPELAPEREQRSRAVMSPGVVEDELKHVGGFVPRPSGAMKSAAWWITPMVLGVIVIARIISGRAWVMAAVAGGLSIALAGGLVWWLSSGVAAETRTLAWTARGAPGNMEIRERLELWNTMRGEIVDIRTGDAIGPIPVTATEEGWFRLGENLNRVLLETGGSAGTGARFISRLRPWETRLLFARQVRVAWPLPAKSADDAWKRDADKHGIDLAKGAVVVNGQVAGAGAKEESLTSWIGPPGEKPAMSAWYQLRFWGARRYVILEGKEGQENLIVDFGPGD